MPSDAAEREELGKLVRDVWIHWAKEQPDPKPSWLLPWEAMAEDDREVDRRIGEMLYWAGYELAKAEAQRADAVVAKAVAYHEVEGSIKPRHLGHERVLLETVAVYLEARR